MDPSCILSVNISDTYIFVKHWKTYSFSKCCDKRNVYFTHDAEGHSLHLDQFKFIPYLSNRTLEDKQIQNIVEQLKMFKFLEKLNNINVNERYLLAPCDLIQYVHQWWSVSSVSKKL